MQRLLTNESANLSTPLLFGLANAYTTEATWAKAEFHAGRGGAIPLDRYITIDPLSEGGGAQQGVNNLRTMYGALLFSPAGALPVSEARIVRPRALVRSQKSSGEAGGGGGRLGGGGGGGGRGGGGGGGNGDGGGGAGGKGEGGGGGGDGGGGGGDGGGGGGGDGGGDNGLGDGGGYGRKAIPPSSVRQKPQVWHSQLAQ